MEVIEARPNRNMLIAGGAALALVAALGGILIGRSLGADPTTVNASVEGGETAEEGHGREGFVEMDAARAAAAGIRVETAAAGTLTTEIIAQATVAAPPEGRASLTARMDGTLTQIFRRLGDPVRAGETVALLESREAAGLVAEHSAAVARAQAARSVLARERRLFAGRITAQQDLEAAQAASAQAEAELRRTQAAVRAAGVTSDGRHVAVTSLISGRITKAEAQLGNYVAAGTELFEVANPARIQIEVAVPAVDAQRVAPGDMAVIELPAGGTVNAVVRSVTPALNAESRAATVLLTPAGAPPGLTQGQGVRVRIVPRGAQSAGQIVLPEEAVQTVGGRDVVFVQVGGGFQAMPVTIGGRTGGRVEIAAGLRPGLRVVTQGAFLIKAQLGAGEAEH